jgi:hypothetical protein
VASGWDLGVGDTKKTGIISKFFDTIWHKTNFGYQSIRATTANIVDILKYEYCTYEG